MMWCTVQIFRCAYRFTVNNNLSTSKSTSINTISLADLCGCCYFADDDDDDGGFFPLCSVWFVARTRTSIYQKVDILTAPNHHFTISVCAHSKAKSLTYNAHTNRPVDMCAPRVFYLCFTVCCTFYLAMTATTMIGEQRIQKRSSTYIYTILSIIISLKYYNYLCMIKREYVCSLVWPDCLLLTWCVLWFSFVFSCPIPHQHTVRFGLCALARDSALDEELLEHWAFALVFNSTIDIMDAMKLLFLLAKNHIHGERECPRCTWVFKGISKRLITMTQKYAWMHDFVRSPIFACIIFGVHYFYSFFIRLFLPHFHFASRHKHTKADSVTNANRHISHRLFPLLTKTAVFFPFNESIEKFWQFFCSMLLSTSMLKTVQKIDALIRKRRKNPSKKPNSEFIVIFKKKRSGKTVIRHKICW